MTLADLAHKKPWTRKDFYHDGLSGGAHHKAIYKPAEDTRTQYRGVKEMTWRGPHSI